MAAKLPDIETMIQAGINPKNGLPYKWADPSNLPENIKKSLRILDEQNAINRYDWYNLPDGINGQMLERMLYYKGQIAFFKLGKHYFILPYALQGKNDTGLDCYGRMTSIKPVVLGSEVDPNSGKKLMYFAGDKVWIPVYTLEEYINREEESNVNEENACVLIKDYTEQLSQTILPRSTIQEPILSYMSEIFPLARTAMIANSGIQGMRVQDEGQASNVKLASQSMLRAGLTGSPYIPIVGNLDFQQLTNGNVMKSEEYLVLLQAVDNYRLSLYGLKNGGLFQKKAHMLEDEQEARNGVGLLAYADGLSIRQRACDIINYIWGLGVACMPSEAALGPQGMEAPKDDKERPQGEETESFGGGEEDAAV